MANIPWCGPRRKVVVGAQRAAFLQRGRGLVRPAARSGARGWQQNAIARTRIVQVAVDCAVVADMRAIGPIEHD